MDVIIDLQRGIRILRWIGFQQALSDQEIALKNSFDLVDQVLYTQSASAQLFARSKILGA